MGYICFNICDILLKNSKMLLQHRSLENKTTKIKGNTDRHGETGRGKRERERGTEKDNKQDIILKSGNR